MTTYSTQNPLGSSDPRDLYDNAENLDNFVNGEQPAYDDRLGVSRKSWTGMEQDFADFLASSGYQFLGDYAAGIEVTAYNQVIRDGGEFWRLSASTDLPYTTTGAGMPEGGAFVSVGDAILRQDLAGNTGADLVGTSSGDTVQSEIDKRVISAESVDGLSDIESPGGQAAYLNDGYRSGAFTSTADDISVEVGKDYMRGVYVPFSSDPSGASGGWVRDNAEYELNLYWFGASGDYDFNTETPGKIAVNATNNFDAINSARFLLEHRNKGRLIIAGAAGNSDFWFRNMPTFELSDFDLYIAKGTTVRITTPTSFGTVIQIGEAGVTERGSVTGGGTVTTYLPNLDTLPLWQASTSYPAETYVKTSANHVYWTEDGGTTGTTEPTVIAGSETDGTVVWRDALNENGISVAGDEVSVIGMYISAANNKGISVQSPPWRDIVFRDNIIGSTHHDGIEVKGNIGVTSTEIGARATVDNNTVLSAGRHGISIEQPSTGTNKNQDIKVLGNTIVRAGTRHSNQQHHGIRVNRCIRPVVRDNKVISATGNGVVFRQCEDVTGDVFVRNYGIWGLYLDSNETCSFESIKVTGNGGGFPGMRLLDNIGTLWAGYLEITGTNYPRAYEHLSGSTLTVGDADITPGTVGAPSGKGLQIAAKGVSQNFSGFSQANGSASVPSTGRETFLDVSGKHNVISGAIFGGAGLRLEITIDGGSIIQLAATQSVDGAGDEYTVIPIPPCTAFDSLKLAVNNNSGSAKTIAWQVVYS